MVAADFLMSPVFLWVTANAIVIWLVSSSRRGPRTEGAVPSTPVGHDDGVAVHDAVDSSIYTSSSEYEAFPDADSARRARAEAAAAKRLAREAARAARKKADRPRVRKKLPAGHDASTTSPRAVAAAAAPARELDDETRRRAETPPVACAAEPRLVAGAGAGDEDEDEDVSMDSLWQSIVERRAARPVVVQKSESWGNDELPRLQRVAETAATRRAEVRKSVSAVSRAAAPQQPAPQQPPAVPSAIRQLGWRTRDVLVTISPDELLRRAESFIRRQHEHLRLQRQESEQRQLRRGLHAPPLIRV